MYPKDASESHDAEDDKEMLSQRMQSGPQDAVSDKDKHDMALWESSHGDWDSVQGGQALDDPSQLVLDEDDFGVECEDLEDSEGMKELLVRLNKTVAREDVKEWDSFEEEEDEDEDDDLLDCGFLK